MKNPHNLTNTQFTNILKTTLNWQRLFILCFLDVLENRGLQDDPDFTRFQEAMYESITFMSELFKIDLTEPEEFGRELDEIRELHQMFGNINPSSLIQPS